MGTGVGRLVGNGVGRAVGSSDGTGVGRGLGIGVGRAEGPDVGIGEGSGQQCSGRPTSPAWHSSPVHWYSKSYLQPDPWHGSATPQRTLSSAAHTFVASYQSFRSAISSVPKSPA